MGILCLPVYPFFDIGMVSYTTRTVRVERGEGRAAATAEPIEEEGHHVHQQDERDEDGHSREEYYYHGLGHLEGGRFVVVVGREDALLGG